jgi:hypothetical protein
MASKKTSVWETLSKINVSERVEKKYFKNKKKLAKNMVCHICHGLGLGPKLKSGIQLHHMKYTTIILS